MKAGIGPHDDWIMDHPGGNPNSQFDPTGGAGPHHPSGSDPSADHDLKPNPAPDRDYVLRGGDLRLQLTNFLRDVDDLERAMTSLPHVEDDGSSECPFSGELYAKKEELEEKVTSGVNVLQDCLADLEKEKQRCRANLGRIQGDSARLNLQETQDCYSEAESEQQRQYRQVVQDRDAVLVAMGKAEAVLKVSRTRKSPGGTPHRESPSPNAPSGPGGLGKELDGLVSLGPLSDPDDRDN